MSFTIPGLTKEQLAQAAAYAREHDGGIRLAAVSLGFLTLEQLRAILAQEQAAASTSANAAATAPGAPERPAAAALVTPASLTRQEQADRAKVHAKAHGIGFVAALKALGYATAAAAPARAAAAEPPAWARPIARRSELAATAEQHAAIRRVKELQASAAKAHAAKHRIPFVSALKALGLAT